MLYDRNSLFLTDVELHRYIAPKFTDHMSVNIIYNMACSTSTSDVDISKVNAVLLGSSGVI